MSNDLSCDDTIRTIKIYTPSEAIITNIVPDTFFEDAESAHVSKSEKYWERLRNDATVNLYAAKFLQSWGDRMWIFSIPILLLELHREPLPKLFLPALYGFCSGASTILFGPLMGEWVDRAERLHAAKVVAVCQNAAIAVAGFLLAAGIHWSHYLSDWQIYIFIVLLIICGFVSNIFYAGSLVILEKDWVAVIAKKDKDRLAGIISVIRRIELSTSVLCPLFMAFLMTNAGNDTTALVIGIWSCVSIGLEYYQMKRTWKLSEFDMEKPCQIKFRHTNKSVVRKLCKSCLVISAGWRTFIQTEISFAAMSLAFFEATVLVFSGVTNSYAVSQGLSKTTVALLAGGDALTGILGTFIFPIVRGRFSLELIAASSMIFHFVCGSVCVGSNWLPGSPFDIDFFSKTQEPRTLSNNLMALATKTVVESPNLLSLIVFSVGLTCGRFAFWMIDLSGSQLILENIPDEKRGTICAVHYSLKKLLNRARYVLAMVFSSPQTFGFLIISSQMFSVIGYGLFLVYCKSTSNVKLETKMIRKPVKVVAPLLR